MKRIAAAVALAASTLLSVPFARAESHYFAVTRANADSMPNCVRLGRMAINIGFNTLAKFRPEPLTTPAPGAVSYVKDFETTRMFAECADRGGGSYDLMLIVFSDDDAQAKQVFDKAFSITQKQTCRQNICRP